MCFDRNRCPSGARGRRTLARVAFPHLLRARQVSPWYWAACGAADCALGAANLLIPMQRMLGYGWLGLGAVSLVTAIVLAVRRAGRSA